MVSNKEVLSKVRLSAHDKQAALSAFCFHELANDMTCVVASLSMMELNSNPQTSLPAILQETRNMMERMSRTLRVFSKLRHAHRAPLHTLEGKKVAAIIRLACQDYPQWHCPRLDAKSGAMKMQVWPHWLYGIVSEILEDLAHLSGNIAFDLAPSATFSSVTPPLNTPHYFTLHFHFEGVLPEPWHSQITENQEGRYLVWEELMRQMRGWIICTKEQYRARISLIFPCDLKVSYSEEQ